MSLIRGLIGLALGWVVLTTVLATFYTIAKLIGALIP